MVEQHIMGESRDALIARAREQGWAVSPAQVARWHRAGLLPRPTQHALGRARGTCSIYPPGTGDQLLLLCRWRVRERRIAHLAWRLWWAGYPITLHHIRDRLHETAASLSQLVERCITLQSAAGEGEPLIEAIERLAQARLASRALRRTRKRVGRAAFPTFARIMIEVIAGTFTAYQAEDDPVEVSSEMRILARGLGFDVAALRQRPGLTDELRDAIVPLLQRAGAWIACRPWEQAVCTASDFALLQTRDEVRLLLAGSQLTSHRHPRVSRRTHGAMDGDIADQALLVAVWLAGWEQEPASFAPASVW